MFRCLIVGLIVLFASLAPPIEAATAPSPNVGDSDGLQVLLRSVGDEREEARGEIAFRPEDDPDAVWRTIGLTLRAGVGEVTLPLDASRAWQVEVLAEDLWSPAVLVPPGSGSPVELTLWPTGSVSLDLVWPDDFSPVEELLFALRSDSGDDTSTLLQPPGSPEVTCPVEEHRVEGCFLPAGRWNVRFQARGLAPGYLWKVEVQPRRSNELPTLRLRRGGSIFGFVETSEGWVDREELSLELRPMVEPDPLDDEALEEIRQLSYETTLDEKGGFQFIGVPRGAFEVVARQPGFSPATRAPVEVTPGKWTELEEPLVLEPLLRLRISLTPGAGPFGDPWSVALHREQGPRHLEKVATGNADLGGTWTSPPLASGAYALQVMDQGGDSLVWQEVDLGPGSTEVEVEIPLIFVEGEVTLGDDPLEEARLWFGGRSGSERIKTESDPEGSFLVVLPREGSWLVDVVADDPPVQSLGYEVEVEPVADLRSATVTIELPDTRISGEVVDETGLPVIEPAELHIVPLSGESRRSRFLGAETGPGGSFEIVAIPPGVYSIEASSAAGRSDPVSVNVVEDIDATVRLQIQPTRILVGKVVSETGPVPQALVMSYPLAEPGRRPGFAAPTARTRADGTFRLEVPGGARSVRLTVLASGHALASRTFSEGSRVQIELPRVQGTLSLERSSGGGSTVGFVMVRGEPLDSATLETWARMNGAPSGDERALVVPAMPPGSYAYCRVSVEEALLVLAGSALPAAGACTEGYLAPGGELALKAPS